MALQSNSIMPMREFLSKTLYIPTYQREYSWDEIELEDFWADLCATAKDGEDTHFFGQIVVHNDDTDGKKLYIIDGQQRTITSVIFLKALQRVYSECEIIKDTSDAVSVVEDISSLLGRKTRKSNELHLSLGNDDQDYFVRNIQMGIPDPKKKEKKKSQERMRKAYYFFYEKVLHEIEGINDDEKVLDILDAFFESFKDRFQVLYMEATKLNEAFIIFETLNARGKDLETADLLKNYIFSKTKDVKEAEKQWYQMLSDLDGIDPTRYIRHLWNATSDFSREKELYKRIVKSIDTPKKSRDFMNDMATFAPVYHDLANPTDSVFFSNDRLKDSLCALKNMKASAFYPIVLALTAQGGFSEPEIADVVETIETFVFRNYAIAGKVANSAEVMFAKVAKDISDQVLTLKTEIQQQIKEKMVSDNEFKNLFAVWKGSNSSADKYIVRYIFRKIHAYLSDTSEVVVDNSKVHIEHIMPQNGELWTEISTEEHDELLWRLGNLALLDAALNQEMQNKPFAIKKDYFEKSQIRPNEEIAKKTCWGRSEIEERQVVLAGYALKLWK